MSVGHEFIAIVELPIENGRLIDGALTARVGSAGYVRS